MRNYFRQKPRTKFYFTNFRIEASSLRVIDYQGKQIGVLTKQEALRIAQEKGLDLVLIAPLAKPPVAKIIDFKKFLYQENKKQQQAKKGIKKSTAKNVKLSLFIGSNDFRRLVVKTQEFLKEGHQVRLGLLLKGREIVKKPMAFDLINRFIKEVGEVSVATPPKVQGRVIFAVIIKKSH